MKLFAKREWTKVETSDLRPLAEQIAFGALIILVSLLIMARPICTYRLPSGVLYKPIAMNWNAI